MTLKRPNFAAYTTMEELIKRLAATLAALATSDVAAWIAMDWLRAATDPLYMARVSGLASPQRQSSYLMAVLMATEEPTDPEELTKDRKRYVVELLNEIELRYVDPYLKGNPLEGFDENMVAFGSFIQFFMSGRLSYADQIIERMRELDARFDQTLQEEIGVSASQTLTAIDWIMRKLSDGWQSTMEAVGALKRAQESLRVRHLEGKLQAADLAHFGDDPALHEAGQRFADYFPMSFSAEEMRKDLPEIANGFLAAFALRRGAVSDIAYYADAERNPAENAPLFYIDDDTVCCPFRTAMYEGIESRFGRVLSASNKQQRYFEARAKYLERRSMEVLGSLFPADALRLERYYERPDSQNEHDGLILHDGVLILNEAKSSDMVEPSRTPDRAYQRVKGHFKSDRGIQHGFDQAQHIVDLVRNAPGPFDLYAKDGSVLATIDPTQVKKILIICTTMESFRPLAVNLTYLLEKQANQDYPLAVNLFDLETMVAGFLRKSNPAEEFVRYASQRVASMGAVTADDELNLAGIYLKDGNLPRPMHGKRIVASDGSEYFDDLYFEENEVKRTGHTSINEMAVRGVERMIEREAALQTVRNAKPKVGRNETCPCGSGKKYKKCHGA